MMLLLLFLYNPTSTVVANRLVFSMSNWQSPFVELSHSSCPYSSLRSSSPPSQSLNVIQRASLSARVVHKTWKSFWCCRIVEMIVFEISRANMSSTLKPTTTRLIDRIDAIYEQLSDYIPWQFFCCDYSKVLFPVPFKKETKRKNKTRTSLSLSSKTMAKLVYCLYTHTHIDAGAKSSLFTHALVVWLAFAV